MINRYIITITYGDYTIGNGGTDKFVLSQQKLFNKSRYNAIGIFPYKRRNFWNVIINGDFIGVFSNARLISHISAINQLCISAIFIHHLKDVNLDLLEGILDYCDVPIFYYLHDYYTICPISGLVREDGTFCGNGFPSENKCVGCSYCKQSIELSKKIKPLIKKYSNRITFITPSEAAKDVWAKDYPEYRDKVKVIYHQELQGEYRSNNAILQDSEPIRIAFVGYQKPLKGWKQFKDAATKANKLGLNEQFYQFGWGEEKFPYIEQVDVDFKKSITAMTDALRERKIQVAVLWSLWPETYAYTYYEALAANCFVITNENSGNICAQVEERNNGIVVRDLSEILCDESKLRKLVNDFRANTHIAPEELIENKEFLSLIPDTDWHPKRVRKVVDYSNMLTLLKKSKRMIKDWIKRV